MRVPIIASGAFLVIAASRLSATTYHLSPDGSGDFPTIQAAIDAVASGDEIVLSDGTFTGPGNWDLDFATKELVLRSEYGHATTAVDCGYHDDPTASHQGIILQGGQTQATRIEGITIQYVHWTGPGGAIRCVNTSPIVRGVRVRWCTAVDGHGLCVLVEGGRPTIDECVFEDNVEASWYYQNQSLLLSLQSEINLQACTFRSNTAPKIIDVAGGTVTDCVFQTNHGLCVFAEGYGPQPRIWVLRCSFLNNTGNGVVVPSDVEGVIGDCLFQANGGGPGAGVSAFGTTTIRNSHFNDNSTFGLGSAVSFFGPSRSLTLDHCTFAWNRNGTVNANCQNLTVTHCTFYADYGYSSPGGSALTVLGNGTATVDHTIIAFGGQIGEYVGAIHCVDTPSSLEINCTDIFGNEGGDWTGCIAGMEGLNGNLSADPLFCDSDLSLRTNSPCAPPNSGECGLIGALGPWCGPVAVEPRSWGSIKALYR